MLAAFYPLVVLAAGWADLPSGVWAALYAIAIVSMIVGNVGAVVQPNIKRMLAYSSVAHSGYAIVPLVALLGAGAAGGSSLIEDAGRAIAYYFLAYTLMTLLAFGIAASLGPVGESRIAHYAGLVRRNPGVAFMMLLAMISLLGIPGTVGFYGKFKLFSVAVAAEHYRLAVIGVLASVASAYYYLRVVVTMFMQEPAEEEAPARVSLEGANSLALGVGTICIVLFALVPWLYLTR